MLQHALPMPFRLDENQRRIDTTTAHTALRETFGNCIIHCAYTMMCNITIDRFFDRIVMSSPGSMLVSLDEFYEGGHSICHNPVLQKMFVFIGVGEKAGSGADIIAKGWNDNDWHIPTMSEHSHPDRTETILLLPEWLIGNQERLVEKVIERANRLSEKMAENRIAIIREIISNPAISKAELAQIVGISTTAFDKNITAMRDKLIRRICPDKGGR